MVRDAKRLAWAACKYLGLNLRRLDANPCYSLVHRRSKLIHKFLEKSRVGFVDWDRFHDRFAVEIARTLGAGAEPTPWPELNESEVEGLIEQYSSPEWMENR